MTERYQIAHMLEAGPLSYKEILENCIEIKELWSNPIINSIYENSIYELLDKGIIEVLTFLEHPTRRFRLAVPADQVEKLLLL